MMESYGVMKEEILIFNEVVKGTKKNFKFKKLKFFWPRWRDTKFFSCPAQNSKPS
jgi:hypothetical protein